MCLHAEAFRFYPTLKVHLKFLSDHFLSSDDTCIITSRAHLFGLSLKGFSKMLLMAVKFIALKDALPSETRTWKITADSRIRSCFVRTKHPSCLPIYASTGWEIQEVENFLRPKQICLPYPSLPWFQNCANKAADHWLNQGLNQWQALNNLRQSQGYIWISNSDPLQVKRLNSSGSQSLWLADR